VSSIVTRRNSTREAIKDGAFWGFGHSSTIVLVGIFVIAARVVVAEQTFGYLEAVVGVMLIGLGIHRLWKYLVVERHHLSMHHDGTVHDHRLAYGVGLVHGLAGSGALILLVMAQLKGVWESLVYLLIFGVGSVAGMMVASGLFSLPFSQKLGGKTVQATLSLLSAVLCIGFGLKVVWENLSNAS
jgi:ABC-type nickel/cobalt efflux system permease component RcnA